MPLPFVAAGGAIVAELGAVEIAAIAGTIAAAGGLAYLKFRPPKIPTGKISLPRPKTPQEMPGAIKVPENPNDLLVREKPKSATPYEPKAPEIKNPEAEVKKLPENIKASKGQKPLIEKIKPFFTRINAQKKAAEAAVKKELTDLGVKLNIRIKNARLELGTLGKTVPDKKGLPKKILLDTQQIRIMSKALKDDVLKFVSRHEATHAAIRASNGYLRGFGKFSKPARNLLTKRTKYNKWINERFTDILTTAKYQNNMKLLSEADRTRGPFTATNRLISTLKTEARTTGSRAIGTFAKSVQKFANAAKKAGKVLPSIFGFKSKTKTKSTPTKRTVKIRWWRR
ncbi:MAG: hypothetical protein ACE5J7_00480 [Candidatus Aenigmatarchaeota archaeon]